MPAIGTNPLRTFGGGVIHHFIPLIQPAIYIAITDIVVITVLFDGGIIRLLAGSSDQGTQIQVLRHPALGADLNGWIDLSVTRVRQ